MRKDALITLGTQLSIQATGLVTGILVARLLGPAGRGELVAIMAWVSMIVYLGTCGLPAAFTYAGAREPHRVRQLLANGALAVLVQWPMLFLIGWVVLAPVFAKQGTQAFDLSLYYMCVYIPLHLLVLYVSAVLQGAGRYRGFNLVRLCAPLSYLLGLLALLFIGQVTVAAALQVHLLSNLLTLALSLAFISTLVRQRGQDQAILDVAGLWRDARYGISAHLGTLQPFNGLRIDVLLLTLLLPIHDLGLYTAALAGAGLIKAQGMALGMVVMPEVARLPDPEAQRRLVLRFGGLSLLLGGATAAIVLVWAGPLIELVYGRAFEGAVPALRLLVLAAVAASLYRVLADGLRGMGRPLRGTTAELASLAVGIPAIFFLVPSNGAQGGAIAVGLASMAALSVAAVTLMGNPDAPGLGRPRTEKTGGGITVETNESD